MKKILVIFTLLLTIYCLPINVKATEVNPQVNTHNLGSYKVIYQNGLNVAIYNFKKAENIKDIKGKSLKTKIIFINLADNKVYTNAEDLNLKLDLLELKNWKEFKDIEVVKNLINKVNKLDNLSSIEKLMYIININQSDEDNLNNLSDEIELLSEKNIDILKSNLIDKIKTFRSFNYNEYAQQVKFISEHNDVDKLKKFVTNLENENNIKFYLNYLWKIFKWTLLFLVVVAAIYLIFIRQYSWTK